MTNYVCTYLIPLKITPFRYNTLIASVFTNPRNTSETRFLVSPTALVSIFHLSTQSQQYVFLSLVSAVLERGKSQREPSYGFVFGQKLTHKHQCVSCYVIMVQNPCLVFAQFCVFLTNCFAQLMHKFKVVFLVDPTTLSKNT